jgi:hypothetical protein
MPPLWSDLAARSGPVVSAAGAGEERGDDVGGVPVERDSGPVVAHGGAAVAARGPARHTVVSDRLLRPFRLCQPHAPRSLADRRADPLRGVGRQRQAPPAGDRRGAHLRVARHDELPVPRRPDHATGVESVVRRRRRRWRGRTPRRRHRPVPAPVRSSGDHRAVVGRDPPQLDRPHRPDRRTPRPVALRAHAPSRRRRCCSRS